MQTRDLADSYPKVIFFDAMGTLFGLRGSVGEVYGQVAQQFGVEVSAPDLNRAFLQSFKAAPPMAFPGVAPSELLQRESDWWEAIARQTFQKAGVLQQFQDFSTFFAYLYAYFTTAEPWQLYPDTIPTLQFWQNQGIELGIISNFDSRLHPILQTLGLSRYFASVTISTEAGAAKPEAAIFQQGLAKHGVRPDQAWHVGDSIKADYQGARAAGLTGIWLDRR